MKNRNVKIFYNSAFQIKAVVLILLALLIIPFQNCQNKISVADKANDNAQAFLAVTSEGEQTEDPVSQIPMVQPTSPGTINPILPVACNLVSCELTPITKKPAVTTILLALGDSANDQLVVNGASAQLIAETVVRYTTPINNPKILVIKDSNSGTEDPEDFAYLTQVLLSRYNFTVKEETANGFSLSELAQYDLVWLNNPGQPMGSSQTRDSLIAFKGGVVLQGDDMSRGTDFSLEELTKLKYIGNGTDVSCNEQSFHINDNEGGLYSISLDSRFFPRDQENKSLSFSYGNDIDETEVILGEGVEVLATAIGDHAECVKTRPAIVRYFK